MNFTKMDTFIIDAENSKTSDPNKLTSKHLLVHVLKMSSARLQHNNFTSSTTSWRRLEDVLKRFCKDVLKTSGKTSWRHLGRRKTVTLKTSWRRLEDMSWRRREEMSWKSLEDMSSRCFEDISWRYLENTMGRNEILTGNICI